MEDRYGLELSTSSAAARDAYVEAIDRMLAADGQVEDCLAAGHCGRPELSPSPTPQRPASISSTCEYPKREPRWRPPLS